MPRKSHKLFLAAPQSLGHESHLLPCTPFLLTIDIKDVSALQKLREPEAEVYWNVHKIKGNVVQLNVFNIYARSLKQILKFYLTRLGATGYEIQQMAEKKRVPKRARTGKTSNFNTNLKKSK
jgi:hypothetical protein